MVVALAYACFAACLAACAQPNSDSNADEAVSAESILTVRVSRQDMVSEVTTTGQVRPIREIEIKSKASGEVLRFPVETGQIVRAGAILAQVDTTEAATAVRQRRAELDYQRAQLAVAIDRKTSTEELLSRGIVSRAEHNRNVLEHARVLSLIVSTEAALVQALERMSETTVRAPIGGTVIEKLVEAGQIIASATSGVNEGTTLLRTADLTAVQVRVLMDQSNLGRVRPGQKVSVTPDAYRERRFVGRVEKIEPQSVRRRDVTYFPVLIKLENRDGLLLPGMDCSVVIQVSSRVDVLTVSSDAVLPPDEARTIAPLLGVAEDSVGAAVGAMPESSGGALRSGIVFVLDSAAAVVRPVAIEYGTRDWNLTEVLSGIPEGARAIIPPSASVAQHFRQFERWLGRYGVKVTNDGVKVVNRTN